MIKACVFDLDGTTLYTIATITHYINKTLLRYALEPIDEKYCMSIVGKGARNLISQVLDLRGVTDPETREKFLAEYLADYDAAPNYLTEPYEGIVELIAQLRARGIKIATLSNKPDFATRTSVEHFFGDSFDLVFGGRDGIPLKPAPEAADELFSSLGMRAEDVAFIGDSEVDVYTAKNIGAGVKIAVTWGYRTREQLAAAGAETFADTPSEILDLI